MFMLPWRQQQVPPRQDKEFGIKSCSSKGIDPIGRRLQPASMVPYGYLMRERAASLPPVLRIIIPAGAA